MLIPGLGPAPLAMEFGPADPWLLEAALAMLDFGLIQERDVADIEAPLTPTALMSILATAASRLCPGELELLELEMFVVAPDAERRVAKSIFDIEFRATGAYLGIDISGPLSALERHRPGLGRFAAMTMNEALEVMSGPSPPMTPTGAFWMVSCIEWGGELTPDDAIDEARHEAHSEIMHIRRNAEGEERARPPTEQELADYMRPIPTAEDVFGSIPAWAWEPKFQGPAPATFTSPPPCLDADEAAATESLPGPLKRLVDCLVDLAHELPKPWAWSEFVDYPWDGGEVIAWPVVLEWREAGARGLVEAFDNYAQFCMDSGCLAPNTLLRIKDSASLERLRQVWGVIVKTDKVLRLLETP